MIGEILIRSEIKDPRVQDAGLITLTHVRLTGDLQKATALFTVHGATAHQLTKVRQGLNHAGGYLRRRLGKALSVRTVPTVTFEIDQVFEQEERVDALLREIGPTGGTPSSSEAAATAEAGAGDDASDGAVDSEVPADRDRPDE